MRTVIIAIPLFLSLWLSAQKWEKSVNANYNWTYIAQSIEGSMNFRQGHHGLAAGIQVYLNQYADFDDGALKNVGYAENWYDRVGMNFSYHYFIWKDFRTVNPYLFYQNQISHLSFREPYYDTVYYYWGRGLQYSNPHWITENFIGIGFIFQFYENLFLFQEAGIGCAIWGNNPNSMEKIQWEWDYTLKLGLLYRID